MYLTKEYHPVFPHADPPQRGIGKKRARSLSLHESPLLCVTPVWLTQIKNVSQSKVLTGEQPCLPHRPLALSSVYIYPPTRSSSVDPSVEHCDTLLTSLGRSGGFTPVSSTYDIRAFNSTNEFYHHCRQNTMSSFFHHPCHCVLSVLFSHRFI